MGHDLSRIEIDTELSALLTPLTLEERARLEHSLVTEGCREPLVIWKGRGVLLDGHARHEICTRLDISFGKVEVDLKDRKEAVLWVLDRQLARRNLNPVAASYCRGRYYRLAGGRQGGRTDLTSGQTVRGWTAKGFAERYGVDERTVRRDAAFARGMDVFEQKLGVDFRTRVLTREYSLTRQQVVQLAKGLEARQVSEEEVRQRVEEILRQRREGRKGNPAAGESDGVDEAETRDNVDPDDVPPRDPAAKETPLNRLYRAWDEASEDERRTFLSVPAVYDTAAEVLGRRTRKGA